MVNAAEEANMQIVEGEEINEEEGVIEANNNLAVMNHHQARIRKKHLTEDELIERNQHVKMVNNLRITKNNIERKHLLSTYLKNKKWIERLTISIELNTNKKNKSRFKSFNVRKWERERKASKRIVQNIEGNNIPKKKQTCIQEADM
ncbi:unnamed protein product [Eruca vesicaria subsp. sativa]|uniref:Uncharacterized protein n=1 Tax=Eruca vesicaria subsp. sativa TaxID=29727 RepID=A0ABC8KU12_ERUVS|nr:unnamed protein product [Eruca vesicaria subsp. sativa]